MINGYELWARHNLHLEHYAKSRAASSPRGYHEDAMLEEYILRLQEIEARTAEINTEIKKLKKQLIK